MTDLQELAQVVETTTVFAKLSPDRAAIILCLKNNGHKVVTWGDGINDAPSMKVSDVGILWIPLLILPKKRQMSSF